jgi:response regulator RpfG family c-di-GMP phosphodiesterase
MNILIDELTEKVEIEGEECEINTDFRNVLLYFRVLKDEELEERDKLEIAIKLFFKTIPKDIEEAIRYINEEYIGCLAKRVVDPKKIKARVKEKKVFDFEQDGTLIYVSFMQEYGIDLIKTKMHWYEFKALFDGLGEGTVLRRLIEFRRMKPKDMPRERRLELLELQKELGVRVKDPLNYNDAEGTVYRRRAKEIERELMEGAKLQS